MTKFSKFLNIQDDVLLEWVFDDSDYISENYNVLNNINNSTRSFISTANLNKIENTSFVIDEVLKRYTKVDLEKFSFLQRQMFSSSNVPYDTVRINFPSSYDLEEENYLGFIVNVYTYDFYDKKKIPFSQYFFDNQDNLRQKQLSLRQPFLYRNKEWSKTIDFKIPNIDFISNQRTIIDGMNKPIPNTINHNVSGGVGISTNSPIFFEFSFITSEETRFGIKYFTLGDTYNVSIPKIPEYQDLTVNINESNQGDYFEIGGSWQGSEQNFDDFVNDLEQKGQRIRVEYDVSVYEENILQRTQTFIITENFSQNIIYRPVIIFSNTTAIIEVNMKVIDVITESSITRRNSIGLIGNDLLKYGSRLSKMNVSNAIKPKIYNLKLSNKMDNIDLFRGNVTQGNLSGFGLNKVAYPVITERFQVLVDSNTSRQGYKGNGILEIVITPFDTILKFVIGRKINEDGDVENYDLSKIVKNSKLMLNFKSDKKSLEKDIFYESGENDLKNGIVLYKIEEQDLKSLSSIYTENNNFYITIVNDDSGSRTMLYSGKFVFYEDISFVDLDPVVGRESGIEGSDNITAIEDGEFDSTLNIDLEETGIDDDEESMVSIPRTNLLIFLHRNSNESIFQQKLENIINVNTQLKHRYNRTYVLLSITDFEKEEIEKLEAVDRVLTMAICMGKDISNQQEETLSLVKKLESDANKEALDWIKSNDAFAGFEGFEPSENARQELIQRVKPILEQLNELGFKLVKNDDDDEMLWKIARDDGKPSYYIEI
jgi:hypothetical protein